MSSGRWRTAISSISRPELEKIGLIDRSDVLDGTVVRVPKAYPAYFGDYGEIGRCAISGPVHESVPVGRNGMHRYNNQDHSMLAANLAVTGIINLGPARRISGASMRKRIITKISVTAPSGRATA